MTSEMTPSTPARYRPYWLTEQGVYGVILVSGLILVSDSDNHSSWDTFFTVVVTVIVFWAAHLFAAVIAHPRMLGESRAEFWAVARDGERHARGLLIAAVLPCAILLLGASDWIGDRDAVSIALWSGVVILAVLGFVAFQRRGYGLAGRLLGAVATGAFGVVLIVIKALVH